MMDTTDKILIGIWLVSATILGYLLIANWNEVPRLLTAFFSPVRGF